MLTLFAVEGFSQQTTHWQARSDSSSTSAAALTSLATTSPASEAYRSFASSVAVPVPSLLQRRFHQSSRFHILCAKNALRRGACSHSRAEADADLTAKLGDWLGLDTEMCMIKAKKKKSVLLRASDRMLCEGIRILFWGEGVSVRSEAFRGKMWLETEIKITVAFGHSEFQKCPIL